jgi:Fic family protein
LRVHSLLQRKPIISIPLAADDLQLTPPTVRSAIGTLGEMGMVREITGKLRDRLFVYNRYMDLLQEDIEET